MFAFCRSVKLPTTLEDIGLKNATDDELMRVAESTCADGETIFNEPMPITPGAVFNAIKAADAIGKKLKATVDQEMPQKRAQALGMSA